MLNYIVRRVGQSILVIVAALIFVFLVGHVIGDPIDLMLPVEAPQELRDRMRENLGFDQSLWGQFLNFVERALGGFGDSIWQKKPALETALGRIGPTLLLTGAVLLLSVPLAIGLGSLAALKVGTATDRAIIVFTLGGISTVDFWLGLMLILLFSVGLGWLPTGGYGGLSHLILPAVALSYRSVGRIAQITRSAMLDEYAKPYIQVARANGMPEHIVFLHALKNASIPVLTISGDETAALMGGTFAIESIFAWPGIGRLLVQAITHRDLFLIEATVFVIVIVIITINLIIDLTYAYVDPKVRYR